MARRLPFRVLLTYKGIPRKFVTFIVGKDNSFYIHQNRPGGQGWRIPRTRSRPDQPHKTFLDFANFTEPPFEMHKLTIHRSGFIHTTDKTGKRYTEGTRGPSFATMKLPYDICVFVPCVPDLLPAYDEPDRSYVADLKLPDEIAPFHMTISVISAAAPPPAVPGPLLPQQPRNFLFEGLPYGLAFTLWPVKTRNPSETATWPPFPFFLVRTGA